MTSVLEPTMVTHTRIRRVNTEVCVSQLKGVFPISRLGSSSIAVVACGGFCWGLAAS